MPADRKVLWKLVDGKMQPTPVKIGLSDGAFTELVEGELSRGDLLVTEITGVSKSKAIKLPGAF
jgi:hypothetical protein